MAVIVAAVVLVPICNSIADEGNTGNVEGPVLYTNEGDFYYDDVSDSTQIEIALRLIDNADGSPYLGMNINGEPFDCGEIPAWTSEHSMDVASIPLFVFKTSDGRYGVEGIMGGGIEDTDSEQVKLGGIMYYRMIQGDNAPSFCYIYLGTIAQSAVTLANGQITYDFDTGETLEPINGQYIIAINGQSSGQYTRSSSATVIDSTRIFVSEYTGSVLIEVDELGDAIVVFGDNNLGLTGSGTVSSIANLSDLSIYDYGKDISGMEVTLDTEPIEGEQGIRLVSMTSDIQGVSAEYYNFIVPVEVREQIPGDGSDGSMISAVISIIPIFVILAILMGAAGLFYQNRKTI